MIIKKDILSTTQHTINDLRYLVLYGTEDIPKKECQGLIDTLEDYLKVVAEHIIENQRPTTATV